MRTFVLTALTALTAALPAEGQRPQPDAGPVGPGGVHATIDLPAELHMRNTGGMGRGGPGTGAGLCVFTSVEMAARWHGLHEIDGLQKWMTHKPGGGYPEKLQAVLEEFCASKGVAVPPYAQAITRGNPAFMEAAFRNRLMCSITWTPAHMLNGMHLDGRYGSIVDNNRPGVWQWPSRDQYLRTWSQGNYGWVFVWLAPPPPPGQDGASPVPGPAPPPGPEPCPGPYCPTPNRPWVSDPSGRSAGDEPGRYEDVTYADGVRVRKVYDSGDRLLGVFSPRGWHPAVTQDSWLARPQAGGPEWAASIDWSRTDASRERYWVNGREVTLAEATRAIEQRPRPRPRPGPAPDTIPDTIPDTSDRCYLTVVGGKADAALRANPLYAKVHYHEYAADDWPVRYGRCKAGVALQGPDGRVRFRSDKTTPEVIAEALKYTDPAYTPPPPPRPPEPQPPEVAPAPRPRDEPQSETPGPQSALWALVLFLAAKIFRR